MKNVIPTRNALILASVVLAFVFSFSACSENSKPQKENKTFSISYGRSALKLIEIDSCQYLIGEWGKATVLTHKGNCSHCFSTK